MTEAVDAFVAKLKELYAITAPLGHKLNDDPEEDETATMLKEKGPEIIAGLKAISKQAPEICSFVEEHPVSAKIMDVAEKAIDLADRIMDLDESVTVSIVLYEIASQGVPEETAASRIFRNTLLLKLLAKYKWKATTDDNSTQEQRTSVGADYESISLTVPAEMETHVKTRDMLYYLGMIFRCVRFISNRIATEVEDCAGLVTDLDFQKQLHTTVKKFSVFWTSATAAPTVAPEAPAQVPEVPVAAPEPPPADTAKPKKKKKTKVSIDGAGKDEKLGEKPAKKSTSGEKLTQAPPATTTVA